MAETRGPQLAAAIIVFLVLSWTTVVMRCWVRIRMINNFALDDWLTILTLVLFTVYGGLVLNGVYWGVGMHMVDLSVQERINGMKAWWACELIYIIDTTILRLAVGAFLLRIAVKKVHRQVIYSMIVLDIVFNIYFFLQSMLQCLPINFFYMQFDGQEKGHCNFALVANSTYAQSAISALIDWTFGIMPIFLVWDLNMNTRKKVLVGTVLSLGAIASAATIIRLPFVYTLTHSEDFLWDTSNVAIWSSVEPGLGITALNLATLRPLVRKFALRFGLTTESIEPSYSFHDRYGRDGSGMRRAIRNSFRPPLPPKEKGYSRQSSSHLDEEAQLRGLHPQLGNISHVEAGVARKSSCGKLQKQNRSRNSSRGRSIASSEDEIHITKTTDVITWTDHGVIQEPERTWSLE